MKAASQARAPEACSGIRIGQEQDFDFRSEEYRELFAASDATAFQHPDWLAAFYRTLLEPNRATAVVVTGRDEATGQLCFVLPLILRRRYGIDVIEAAYLGVADYAHPVARTDWRPTPELFDAIMAVLPPHDVLNIRPIRKKAVSRWLGFLRASTRPLDYSAHAIELATPFEHWRSAVLDQAVARSLDRRKRRFSRAGEVELVRLTDPAEIVESIEAIARYRAGRFTDDCLQNDFVRKFYATVAVSGTRGDFARVYRLTLDGEEVALTFGLAHGGRFYSLLGAADYARFGKYSPGILVDDLIIEEWVNEGGAVYDFTIGDEPYKKTFGTAPSAIHAVLEPVSLKGALAVAGHDAYRGARRMVSAAPALTAARAYRKVENAFRRVFLKTTTAFVLFVRPLMAECVALV